MTKLPKVSIILISYLIGAILLAVLVFVCHLPALLLITLIAPIYYVAVSGARWVMRAMLVSGVVAWLIVSVLLVEHSVTTVITELVVILAIILSTELLGRQAHARLGAESRERSAEQQVIRQNAYLAALHETSLGLLNRLDLNDLLEALVVRASQLLNAENGFVYFEDLERQVVEMKVATGAYTRYQGQVLLPNQGAAGKSWFHKAPIVLENYAQWPERIQDPYLNQIGALIVMPLVSGNRAIGAIGVSTCDSARRFSAAEVQVIERFAELAVMALDNARLYGDARREISARRQAEDALRREQNLFIGGPVVVFKWRAAAGWPVEYVSPNIDQFGYAASDFTSGDIPYREFVYPEDRARVAAEVRGYSKTDLQYFEQDYRIICSNGQERWIYDYTVMMRNEAGEITHYDGYIMDVTERKQSERLQRAFEEQLRESQRLESLGLLAGGVAHDFNNMLAMITGNAGLALLDLEEQHPARESVKQIEIAASHAATLTRQLLAYAGKGRFLIQLIELNKLIEEIAALLQASVTRKHQLVRLLTPNSPPIMADTAQITQVVMNLIVNASEAIGDVSGTITLRTHYDPAAQSADGSGTILLEVHDTGTGMDEATLARIFEPFFTTKFVGRGLGLSAVQGIVRGHGGTIQVASQIGNGTTFTIALPAAVPEIPAPKEPVAPEQQVEPFTRQTILVVDDEEYIRVLTQRILERHGLAVLLAHGGQHAIEIFEQHSTTIGFVLLDLTMPHLSGEQTLQRLIAINPDVPIVLMSGYSQYELEPSLKENARVGFLAKPFTPADLVRLAEKIFSQQYVKTE